MLTWLRARWARAILGWQVAWSPIEEADLARVHAINRLLSSDVMTAARWAVHKTTMDGSLKGAKYNQVRAETVEWTKAYCAQHGVTPTNWQVRVCIELAIGQADGLLEEGEWRRL